MIYLISGANGAGKTLNTLKLVREKQVAEGRSVYYNGFAMKPEKASEFGWKEFDPKEWQKLPDGAILIADECQNEFPVRGASAAIPEYVRALSEHRRRGFDFFMITQHPQNVDMFVRRLIGSPGWHRHLKRSFGANMVSVLEWSAVNPSCEKDGSGKSARVSMVPYPSEVYSWYDSSSLHTAKRSIPRQVYMLGLAALLVPLLFYGAFKVFNDRYAAKAAPASAAAVAGAPVAHPPNASGAQTTSEFIAAYAPRIEGLPHTAPRYDDVTKPTIAPVPAACITMGNRCDCYTQQGTKLQTPANLCKQIVAGGFFMDWENGGGGSGRAVPLANGDLPGAAAGPSVPMGGNPGSSPAVAMAELKQEAQNVGDMAALASMRIGKRPVSAF